MKNLFKLFEMSEVTSLALFNIMKEHKTPLALSSLLSFMKPFFEITFIVLVAHKEPKNLIYNKKFLAEEKTLSQIN